MVAFPRFGTYVRARHIPWELHLAAFNGLVNVNKRYASYAQTRANLSASLASTAGKYRSTSLKSESECANRHPRVKSIDARHAF